MMVCGWLLVTFDLYAFLLLVQLRLMEIIEPKKTDDEALVKCIPQTCHNRIVSSALGNPLVRPVTFCIT